MDKDDKLETNSNEENYEDNKKSTNNNTNLPFMKKDKNLLKFSDVDEKETQIFLKLLKSWLVKFSNLEKNLSNVSNNFDEDLIINLKTNFARVKLFLDYFEMSLTCPKMTISMEKNFIKFSKFTQNLTKKILLASKKINSETTIFTDIILVNYPYIIEKLDSKKFQMIVATNSKNGQIYAFKRAFVVKLKSPTFLLWSKKIFYTCECKSEKGEFFQKFFNIYKNQTEKNFANVYESMCSICKKPYIQDKNSDILIECQEITFAIDTECGNLVNNMITVWTYGDLINSVKEGDCVSLITFYLPNSTNTTYEKDFEYGSFIALNFNIFLFPTFILKEKNFEVKQAQSKNLIEKVLGGNVGANSLKIGNFHMNLNPNVNQNFSMKFNENSDIDILRSVNFQRQLNSNFMKFVLQNFIANYEIRNSKNFLSEVTFNNNSDSDRNSFNFFLHLVLDLSITQRDYLNKTKKSAFMSEREFENKLNANITNKNDKSHLLNSICQSRNLSLKTKIFENTKKEKFGKQKNHKSQEEELSKHFRLSRQIDYQKYFDCMNSSHNHSLMTKPLNIFLIFDDVNRENFRILENYSKIYKNLISIYPYFNTNKFSKEFFMRFLITCNNGIIIIPSIELLSKNEIELIHNVMNENNQNYNLNIAFWFCGSFSKLANSGKKNSNNSNANSNLMFDIKNKNYENILNKCEIVLNFSKKFNKFRGVSVGNILSSTDKNLNNEGNSLHFQRNNNELKIANFSVDFSCDNLEKEFMKISNNNKFDLHLFQDFKLLKYMNNKEMLKNVHTNLCKINHYFNKIPNSNDNQEVPDGLNFDDSFSSAKLMEDYFIIKRKVSNVEFDDLFSILRISIFLSMLRNNYNDNKISYPSTITNINYLDVIVTIFIYEEYAMFKYGLESSSFGNTIGKIIHSDITEQLVAYINEMTMDNLKVKDCVGMNRNTIGGMTLNSPMIPKSRSSLKKFAIGFDFGIDYLDEKTNMKIPSGNGCVQCNRLLNISLNNKLEDFLEKLTIFTYNNN